MDERWERVMTKTWPHETEQRDERKENDDDSVIAKYCSQLFAPFVAGVCAVDARMLWFYYYSWIRKTNTEPKLTYFASQALSPVFEWYLHVALCDCVCLCVSLSFCGSGDSCVCVCVYVTARLNLKFAKLSGKINANMVMIPKFPHQIEPKFFPQRFISGESMTQN